MKIIAVDPGKTTGVATFNGEGKLQTIAELKYPDEFAKWLHIERRNIVWVVEDFKLLPPSYFKSNKAMWWNSMFAPKVIGAIESLAIATGNQFILQQPNIKPIGYKLMGAEYKKGKKNVHVQDAICHGFYYFHKQGIIVESGTP